MDLEMIEEMLPNGFHDAYLSELRIDLVRREVCLFLYALFGDDDQPEAERYKKCKMTIHNYAAAIIETAVAYREIKGTRGLEVDRTALTEADQRSVTQAGYKIPTENFWLSLFVYAWNSRIIVNAPDATIEFL
jgi:hypothetical protein